MKKISFLYTILLSFLVIHLAAAQITVITPNGGESISVGSPYSISWNFVATTASQDVFNVELLLNNATYRVLATNIAPTAIPFLWNVPADLPDRGDYRIRVVRTTNSASNDVSDANFAIRGGRNISITAPTSTSVLTRGMNFNITWAINFADNVKIDLLVNGAFSQTLSNSSMGNSFSWTVPAALNVGNNYQIRISSVTDANVIVTTNTFAVEQNLVITAPNGSESFAKGSMQTIRWTPSANVTDNVKIELISFNTVQQTISASIAASVGMIAWTVPTVITDGATYRIRITSLTNPNLIDESDANFAIGIFVIISNPAAGAVLSKGTPITVRWTTNIFALLRVELILNGIPVRTIGFNIPSNTVNTLEWTPQNDLASSDGYIIRVQSLANPIEQGISSVFSVITPSTIQVNSPTGGESWQKNKNYDITWQSNVQGNLQIDLFRNDTLFRNITPSIVATAGRFSWLVPSDVPIANNYKVNIRSLAIGSVTGRSPANFSVVVGDSIQITNPIANANLVKSTDVNIAWTTNISSRNVAIELIRDGAFFSTISASTANTGTFTWKIPDRIENDQILTAGTYRIRIRTATGDLVTNSSALFNIIEPTFILASPNGGEQFFRGFSYPIIWNSNLSGGVKIDLYNSNIIFLSNISPSSTGSLFNWTVPNDLAEGSFYSVRLTSLSSPTITAASNGNFRVAQGQIQITSPRGAESWYSNSFRYTTQWTNNTLRPVRVELIRANSVVSVLSASTTATSLVFTLPDGLVEASDYRIRVSSVENSTLVAESNTIRIIRPSISITTPANGVPLIQELSYPITWQSNLPADELMQIDLYIGGIYNRTIANSVQNIGSFSWLITTSFPFGTNYTIRVSTIRAPNVFGQNTAPFSIIRDNIPPVVSNEDFPALFNASDGTITSILPAITATDNVGLTAVRLNYRSISKKEWQKLNTRQDGGIDRYRLEIPKSEFENEIGVEYYFEAVDRAGNVTLSPREGENNPRTAHISYRNQNIPDIIFGETAAYYQIISVPLALNDKTVKGIFEPVLGAYDDKQWRLLRYQDGGLAEVGNQEKNITEIEAGKGYWLIIKDKPVENLTTGEGTTVKVSSAKPFTLNLEAGWNQIGNPYNYNLSWKDILEGNNNSVNLGNIRTFEKEAFKNTDVLPRYRGAFVFAANPMTLRFPTLKNRSINSGGRVENEEVNNPLSAPNWEVKLFTSAGKVSNSFAGFGMNPSAEILKDKFDDMTLPRFGKYVEVNFNRPSYFYSKFTKDIVPTQDNFVWEFTVEANAEEKFTKLQWDNSYFGNEKKLILFDKELQRFVDMSAVKEYAFSRNVDKYRFKAIFGDERFVTENLQADKIVFDNFPNPLSSQTQFNFSLPLDFADSHVSLKVYNAMGQEVATLASKNYAAGFHQLHWEAKDQNSNSLAKGLYICRLHIENAQRGLSRVVSRSIIIE